MSKGKKTTAESDGKKLTDKINVRDLVNYLMMPLATIVIVGIGVFIPAILLKGRSDPNKLPAGYVDIENVQPYGAAYKATEQKLDEALTEYYTFCSGYYSMFSVADYPYRDIALYDDMYEQIGTYGSGNEFVYDLSSCIQDNYETPGRITDPWEVRDLSENVVFVGDPDIADGFVLDRQTGVPIYASFEFTTTSEECDPLELIYDIVDLYNAHTGLDFSTEAEVDPVSNDSYSYELLTSDNVLVLRIETYYRDFYYYEEGSAQNGEHYYVWRINLYVLSAEEVSYSGAVG